MMIPALRAPIPAPTARPTAKPATGFAVMIPAAMPAPILKIAPPIDTTLDSVALKLSAL